MAAIAPAILQFGHAGDGDDLLALERDTKKSVNLHLNPKDFHSLPHPRHATFNNASVLLPSPY